jgi:hypothetical protein
MDSDGKGKSLDSNGSFVALSAAAVMGEVPLEGMLKDWAGSEGDGSEGAGGAICFGADGAVEEDAGTDGESCGNCKGGFSAGAAVPSGAVLAALTADVFWS